MNNKTILKELNNAINNITNKNVITPDELGASALLNPGQFDEFVREIQDATVILDEARYQEMDREKLEIDRIAFKDRVLRGGGANTELDESDYAETDTSENVLSAEELLAIVSLKDHTIRRNIERGNLENTLIELLGEAAGRDLEEYGIFADEDITVGSGGGEYPATYINLTDAWVSTAGNKIYDDTTELNDEDVADAWDDTADNWPENLFESLISGTPKKYLTDRGDWRFYVPWRVENDYRDLLKDRGTQLGDTNQTEYPPVMYKGIQVVYVPMIERGIEEVAMLQHPDNMVWGVFHEVELETEREAKKRRTDFVLTVEADAKYEDENASTIGINEDETDSDY